MCVCVSCVVEGEGEVKVNEMLLRKAIGLSR